MTHMQYLGELAGFFDRRLLEKYQTSYATISVQSFIDPVRDQDLSRALQAHQGSKTLSANYRGEVR